MLAAAAWNVFKDRTSLGASDCDHDLSLIFPSCFRPFSNYLLKISLKISRKQGRGRYYLPPVVAAHCACMRSLPLCLLHHYSISRYFTSAVCRALPLVRISSDRFGLGNRYWRSVEHSSILLPAPFHCSAIFREPSRSRVCILIGGSSVSREQSSFETGERSAEGRTLRPIHRVIRAPWSLCFHRA